MDLGLAPITVSKALRDRPDISKETKVRVLDRVKQLNYRPNLTARSLITGRSSMIGLIVPNLVHPFFSQIAKALSSVLRQKKYFLIVCSSDGESALEQEEIEHMLEHRVDCLVVASCQKIAESLRGIRHGGINVILLDRNFRGFRCNFAGSDDYKIEELGTSNYTRLQAYRSYPRSGKQCR